MGLRLAYEHVGCSYTNQSDAQLGDGWWHLMPRTSLQYSFSKGNVYGTVSRGYRSGGYDCLANNGAPQLYRPEYAWNYELGTHLNLLRYKLFLDASVFLTNVMDQQIVQMTPLGLELTTKNAGQSRSLGGEFSLRSKLTDCLQAHATYGYTHATFTDYEFSADVSYNDNYVPFFLNNHDINEYYSQNNTINIPFYAYRIYHHLIWHYYNASFFLNIP